jgi:predicted dehydrogenase
VTVRPLRVGVVGLGFGERVHIPGWQRVDDVTVAAVCSRHGAEDVAARTGSAHWTNDWQELVADPELDIVSVATPPAAHFEIALAALRNGKAVLCEKPLTVRLQDAEQLANEATTPTAVNFSYRALTPFRAARAKLTAGRVGALREVRVRWHVPSRLEAAAWSWKDSFGEGGALASYGVHVLDYVEWLAGPAAELAASFTVPDLERDGRRVTSDDACGIAITLASGAQAAIDVSLVGTERIHRVELVGESGTLMLENRDARDPVGTFSLTLDGEKIVEPSPSPMDDDPRVEPFTVLAASLAAAVRSGEPMSPSFDDGLRAQQLIEIAHAAAASRSALPVPARQTTR